MVVFGLGKNLLFKSMLGRCVTDPDHCAKKDTYMMREIRSLIQEMAHKTHVLYLGVQEKAKQRSGL